MIASTSTLLSTATDLLTLVQHVMDLELLKQLGVDAQPMMRPHHHQPSILYEPGEAMSTAHGGLPARASFQIRGSTHHR